MELERGSMNRYQDMLAGMVTFFLFMVFGGGSIVHLIHCGDYRKAVYRVDLTTEGLEPDGFDLHACGCTSQPPPADLAGVNPEASEYGSLRPWTVGTCWNSEVLEPRRLEGCT